MASITLILKKLVSINSKGVHNSKIYVIMVIAVNINYTF